MPYIGNPIYQSAFVTDQFSGTGSQTAYTMSVAPAGTTNVLVVVSGVVQDPSTYGVVGNTLTFSAAPPSGTGNISCRYLGVPVTGVVTTAYRTVTEFTATASQTTFTPPSYNVGFINVYRNGVLLGSADYTATNGTTVVLSTGATAGDLVTVESFRIDSVLNALPQSGGTLAGNLVVNGSETINGRLGIGTAPTTDLITALGVAGSGSYISAKRPTQSAGEVGYSIYGGTSGTNWAIYQPTSSNDFRIWTSGANDCLKIDSSGRMTLPNQPAFSAYLTSNWAKGSAGTSTVPFDAKYFDIGGNYNTSTYRFTAPIAGRYFFAASTGTTGASNTQAYFGIVFTVNGSSVLDGWNRQETSGYLLDAKSVLLSLSAGDYVECKLETAQSTTIGSPNTSRFGGYLVG